MTLKDKTLTTQAIATTIAILVGGIWTYTIFIKERKHYPHATVTHKISHISLSDETNLLRVAIVITNSGTCKVILKDALIRIHQILPIFPYPKKQVELAKEEVERKDDRFSWPLVASRKKIWDTPLEIEPGEHDELDFEFAIDSNITNLRVYSFFRNETKKELELGWQQSSFYELKTKNKTYTGLAEEKDNSNKFSLSNAEIDVLPDKRKRKRVKHSEEDTQDNSEDDVIKEEEDEIITPLQSFQKTTDYENIKTE